MTLPQPSPLPCNLVNNVSSNSIEQCKFIIDNDCLENDSVVDYVYLVYCEFGHELKYASMALIVFLVIVLFLALSAIADEFLCPSLLALAKHLRMSDSLAGVTLLAFGNGCPDIFSSLAAASDDRGELIVGELLGAGIFCTSIVSGIIFIHSDFKLACRPILRDTSFYLLAVYLMWYYCYSLEITFYGSLAFILIYVIYLIVALSGQAIHSRLKGDYAIAETQTKCLVEENEKNENWFRWREESLKRRQRAQKEKESEVVSLNNNQPRVQHINGITTIYLNSSSHQSNDKSETKLSPLGLQLHSSTKWSSSTCDSSLTNGKCAYVNTAFLGTEAKEGSFGDSMFLKKKLSNPELNYDQPAKLVTTTTNHWNELIFNELDEFLTHINPIDKANWSQANVFGKIFGILRAPLLLAALLTVPVLDHDKKLNNWCRLLNSLHCITTPLAFSLATHIGIKKSLYVFGVPFLVPVLLCGLVMGTFVLKTSNAQQPPKYHSMFAYIGFIMSILWIYLLATEIISLLKTVGIIFSMSDTAIGLGILAWGNSLGDIVANISLANAGYPRMAIGASIGAPLLNLLLGFGLSFTINLKPGQSTPFDYTPTITLLCSTLAIILLSLMLSTFVPPDRSKKPFGYLLICCYGVYFLLAVCLECGLINV